MRNSLKIHRLILSLTTIIALVMVVGIAWSNLRPGTSVDDICTQGRIVQLSEKFRLSQNCSVGIESTGLEIEITKFYNSPCPPYVVCVWSGQGIHFTYKYGGQVKQGISLSQVFGHQIETIDTDYSTYADIIVSEVEKVLDIKEWSVKILADNNKVPGLYYAIGSDINTAYFRSSYYDDLARGCGIAAVTLMRGRAGDTEPYMGQITFQEYYQQNKDSNTLAMYIEGYYYIESHKSSGCNDLDTKESKLEAQEVENVRSALRTMRPDYSLG